MGGSSEQKIGDNHFLGIQLVYAIGQCDGLLALKFDEKLAWTGNVMDGRIMIDKPDLFGGKKKEGGVSGYIDVLSGHAEQERNDYLVRLNGEMAPPGRGVTALVFRQFNFGKNPYFKSPSAKLYRTNKTPDGDVNWYVEKAAIGSQVSVQESALYIALDGSGSMLTNSRMDAAKTAIIDLLELLKDSSDNKNDIKIVLFGTGIISSIQRRRCKSSDYDDLISYVGALNAGSDETTNFDAAVSGVKEFFDGDQTVSPFELLNGLTGFSPLGRVNRELFGGTSDSGSGTKRRIFAIITDGVPDVGSDISAAEELALTSDVEQYGFNIDLADTSHTALLDNTSVDGVPVVTEGDSSALLEAFSKAFTSGYDYNPAHFLRDVILYPSIGTTDLSTNIGDTFTAAADLFYSEGFGISLKFQSPNQKRENKKEIERHVDARVYIDRQTLKWEIKPIRNDYVKDDLFVIDTSNGFGWSGFSQKIRKSLPNQVTLVYSDPDKNQPKSITLTNAAMVQMAGRVINEKVEYFGIRDDTLARRVCLRDLNVLSSPLKSGVVNVFDLPEDLNIGHAVVLTNQRLGITSEVFRIADMKEGDGVSNFIDLDLVQDAFTFRQIDFTDVALVEVPVTSYEAEPVDYRLSEEGPYYEMVANLGQRNADDLLVDVPEVGFIKMIGLAPTQTSLDATIYVDTGSGYDGDHIMTFSPGGLTQSDLKKGADNVQVIMERTNEVQNATIGSLAVIGTEYVRIDSVVATDDMFDHDDLFSLTDVFSDLAIITVGRACLDTVMEDYDAGLPFMFWLGREGTDTIEYYDGESVDVKLLTRTGREVLLEEDADADTIVFDQRALRPYPPGNLQWDAAYSGGFFGGDVDVTWSDRNRLTQTTAVFEDHTYGDITPEVGTSYRLEVFIVDSAFDEALHFEADGVVSPYVLNLDGTFGDTFGVVDLFDLDDAFDAAFPNGVEYLSVRISSLRDGLYSMRKSSIDIPVFLPPTNLTLTEV